jgi:hypothetical protein
MSATVKSVYETLKTKGGYKLKEKVRVFVDKKNLLGFYKSKKFKVGDDKAIDRFVDNNGQIMRMSFSSDKGNLTYTSSAAVPIVFMILELTRGMPHYYKNEADKRGVSAIISNPLND